MDETQTQIDSGESTEKTADGALNWIGGSSVLRFGRHQAPCWTEKTADGEDFLKDFLKDFFSFIFVLA